MWRWRCCPYPVDSHLSVVRGPCSAGGGVCFQDENVDVGQVLSGDGHEQAAGDHHHRFPVRDVRRKLLSRRPQCLGRDRDENVAAASNAFRSGDIRRNTFAAGGAHDVTTRATVVAAEPT